MAAPMPAMPESPRQPALNAVREQDRLRHIRADLVRAKDTRPQMLNKNEVHKSIAWFLWHLINSGEPVNVADLALARSVMEIVR